MIKDNILVKLLSSIPIILVLSYFLPIIGVFLIILRFLTISDFNKRKKSSIFLIAVGFLIYIPLILSRIFNMINFDTSIIPYFNNIINNEIYTINFIACGRFLLLVGIIFLVISITLESLFFKFSNLISRYISEQERMDYEISKENDLIMKEKQYKAENTQVVCCPYCGADNVLTDKTGTCSYCRRKL